ncbi:hypothetical protein IFM89_021056 [Coptis chinensis]|uniref:Leucine-rich repeat-containing N-terminal plant-type domain-containing protein n=1 Tax=Coptis chinensis TaxID=261450 RepID=A0A835H4G6_9MAGN|nr:hypothetical protein IFM89_021056 [Coptis chinensis]
MIKLVGYETTLLDIAGAMGYPMNLTQSWPGNDACHGWTFITCDSQGKNVTVINFSKQHFLGTISPAYGDLASLRNLLLNDNNLTGSIPDGLIALPQLQVLDVSNNNLTGKIPSFPPKVNVKTSFSSIQSKHIISFWVVIHSLEVALII